MTGAPIGSGVMGVRGGRGESGDGWRSLDLCGHGRPWRKTQVLHNLLIKWAQASSQENTSKKLTCTKQI